MRPVYCTEEDEELKLPLFCYGDVVDPRWKKHMCNKYHAAMKAKVKEKQKGKGKGKQKETTETKIKKKIDINAIKREIKKHRKK